MANGIKATNAGGQVIQAPNTQPKKQTGAVVQRGTDLRTGK